MPLHQLEHSLLTLLLLQAVHPPIWWTLLRSMFPMELTLIPLLPHLYLSDQPPTEIIININIINSSSNNIIIIMDLLVTRLTIDMRRRRQTRMATQVLLLDQTCIHPFHRFLCLTMLITRLITLMVILLIPPLSLEPVRLVLMDQEWSISMLSLLFDPSSILESISTKKSRRLKQQVAPHLSCPNYGSFSHNLRNLVNTSDGQSRERDSFFHTTRLHLEKPSCLASFDTRISPPSFAN